MANIFVEIENDVKALWKREEPTIEAGLKDLLKDAEPIFKTALGSIVLATVTGLEGFAATNGGEAAAGVALTTIMAAAEKAGITVYKSLVNMLIELAVQKVKAVSPGIAVPAPTPAS